jgi:lipopolysaccharide transport system ATP-binding protein
MRTVIRVENIAKRYLIGAKEAKRDNLREVVIDAFTAPFRRFGSSFRVSSGYEEEFWALKDVSFDVEEGDVLGIIGRNGAGKSTLLKILSKITEPTEGTVKIKGRIASLLEVGTGFHPELTGRENIYLNGAILGMSRREINRKFNEIVDFSDIEKFLDTPVKHYSSGMYVRLAFAVAAHLEPEILIVDEVLAVGDALFQKKCLGKMKDVGRGGRTVIFVSHSMVAIKSLCKNALYLQKGKVADYGNVQDVVETYERSIFGALKAGDLPVGLLYRNPNPCTEQYDFIEVSMSDGNGVHIFSPKTFTEVRLHIKFYSPRQQKNGAVAIFIRSWSGATILRFATRPDKPLDMDFHEGYNRITCVIPSLPLPAGTFVLGAGLSIPMRKWLLLREELCSFKVTENDVFNSGFPLTDKHTTTVTNYEWELD